MESVNEGTSFRDLLRPHMVDDGRNPRKLAHDVNESWGHLPGFTALGEATVRNWVRNNNPSRPRNWKQLAALLQELGVSRQQAQELFDATSQSLDIDELRNESDEQLVELLTFQSEFALTPSRIELSVVSQGRQNRINPDDGTPVDKKLKNGISRTWRTLLPAFGLAVVASSIFWVSKDGAKQTVVVTGPVVAESDVIQEALDTFDGDFDIEYRGDEEWAERDGSEGSNGDSADIGFFPQPQKLFEMVDSGEVVAFDSETTGAARNSWPESWNSLVQQGDLQYGVFIKADVKSLVWFQPARFEEKGYEVPATTEEFFALTNEMRVNGDTPLCVGIDGVETEEPLLLGSAGTGQGWVFTDWVEDMVLRQHGLDFYDRWVNHQIPFDNRKVIESMTTVTELWQTAGNVYAQNGTIVTTNYEEAGEPLLAGDCFMHRQASFFPGFLPKETTYAALGDEHKSADLSVFYFPSPETSPDGAEPILVSGDIAAGFNNNPETMEVLRFLSGPAYAEARKDMERGPNVGFLSLAKGQDKSLYGPLEAELLDLLRNSQAIRFDGSDLMPTEIGGENGEFLNQGTSLIAGSEVTVAEAAQNIEQSWPN